MSVFVRQVSCSAFSTVSYHTVCPHWQSCCIVQELFGSEGVEMAVHFLRKGSSRFYSGLGHNKLILSTVDCVWSVQQNTKHALINYQTDLICYCYFNIYTILWWKYLQMTHLHWSYPESAYIWPHHCVLCSQRHIDVSVVISFQDLFWIGTHPYVLMWFQKSDLNQPDVFWLHLGI